MALRSSLIAVPVGPQPHGPGRTAPHSRLAHRSSLIAVPLGSQRDGPGGTGGGSDRGPPVASVAVKQLWVRAAVGAVATVLVFVRAATEGEPLLWAAGVASAVVTVTVVAVLLRNDRQ